VVAPGLGGGRGADAGVMAGRTERRNQLCSDPGVTPPLNNRYSNGPAATRPASAKLPDVVAPLIASTTRIPFTVVGAPGPPALLTWISVEPDSLAPIPEITSLSDGELSPLRKLSIASRPPPPM